MASGSGWGAGGRCQGITKTLIDTPAASFFFLAGLSLRHELRFPRWLGWSGIVFSVLFVVGAFRNITHLVQIVADINNALLPLWMMVLGAALIGYSRLAPVPKLKSRFQADSPIY